MQFNKINTETSKQFNTTTVWNNAALDCLPDVYIADQTNVEQMDGFPPTEFIDQASLVR
jgi:hypothetical protein